MSYFVCQGGYGTQSRSERGREIVAVAQILRAVIGDPGFSFDIFPDEDFERKIECDGGSPGFRSAEDQEFRVRHVKAGAFRFAAVVDRANSWIPFVSRTCWKCATISSTGWFAGRVTTPFSDSSGIASG